MYNQEPVPQEKYDELWWSGKRTVFWVEGVDEHGKRKTEGAAPALTLEAFGWKSKILDVGCGVGWLCRFLQELDADVTGLDYSDYAIQHSVARNTTKGDMTKLPYDDNSFDLIISRENFEHLTVEQADAAFKEMIRVSKKWLYLTIWINTDPNASDTEVLTDLERDPTHITYCTKQFWINRFEEYIKDGIIIRREDKEKFMDWKNKGRCFVFEKVV